jgi:hypothetical protein
MKKSKYYIPAIVLVLGMGTLSSCNKDKEVSPANTTKPTSEQNFTTAKATLEVIEELQNLNDLAMTVSMDGSASPQATGRIAAIKELPCGTVNHQVNEETGAGTITVDYGSGQRCADDVLRKGKIIFTITVSAEGNGVNAEFVGYEANSKKLDGHYTVGITINDAVNYMIYTYDFKNAVLTYADGSKISWNSNYVINFGYDMGETENDTPIITWEMTGGITGLNHQGKAFSAQITSPLSLDVYCAYGITKGTYLLTAEGYSEAVYDFGNGQCDNLATLTIDGKSEQIPMHQ